MTTTPEERLAELVGALDGLDLPALNGRAALQDRTDRKYLVPLASLAGILASTDGRLGALDIGGARRFRYETVYLDTPSLTAYRDAARARPARWKARLRIYLDSGDAWVEAKIRDRRGRTVKHRTPRDAGRVDLAPWERAFLATWVPEVATLRPAATTSYERITLLDPGGASRITVDLALRCRTVDGRAATLPALAVVETKATGRPSIVDRALWAAGQRPVRFSKYCTGLAAITGLPANRWHRTLRRTPFSLTGPTHESRDPCE